MSETLELFATVASADQIDAGVGVVWWATHPPGDYALTVVDYDLFEMPSINADWIGALFGRCADLVAKHKPARHGCHLRVEHPGLISVLRRADDAYRDTQASARLNRDEFDIRPIKEYESRKWPGTLDERAFAIRPLADSGKVIKLETGLRRFGFRAIRTNHLVGQIRRHRPGDAASAGELLHAFVLGVLLGTTPRPKSYFEAVGDMMDRDRRGPGATKSAADGPFGGAYIQGRRPL